MRLNKDSARQINFYTISAVYFLILVGGIVRSMGAGMGCPDWPKCFGAVIPPTSNDDLPSGYEEIYVENRLKKNARLSMLLSNLGFNRLSLKVANDPNIRKTEPFDATKAWVEYVNRLVGVIIGLLIILNAYFAFSFRALKIRFIALASLILVVFQGWVGSLVVSTHLLPGFISFHMFLALLLVAWLIIQNHWMVHNERLNGSNSGGLLALILVLMVIQIFMGVEVREQIDLLKVQGLDRSSWIENLDIIFYVHRSFSLLLTGLIGWFLFHSYRQSQFTMYHLAIGMLILVEVGLGAVMAYFEVPSFSQPLHLLFSSLAFGLILYLLLNTNFKTSMI